MKNYVTVGKILEPYGLKGIVKIISYMHDPKKIFQTNLYKISNFGIEPVAIKLHSAIDEQKFKCMVQGVSNRTDAERLQKHELLMSKDDLPRLPEDEFYIQDLVGVPVLNSKEVRIGVVQSVYNFGANDIIEIKFNNGTVEMYDFNNYIFPSVQQDKIIFVAPKTI